MSVELIVYSVWRSQGGVKALYEHPCYTTMIPQINPKDWPLMSQTELLNRILLSYNGRVTNHDFQKIKFEFDTEEDLTHFLMVWA